MAEWILLAIALYFLISKLRDFSLEDFAHLELSFAEVTLTIILFLTGWGLNLLLEAQNWKIVQNFLRPIRFRTAFLDNLHASALNFISPMMSGEFVARHRTQTNKKDKKRSVFLSLWMHWPKHFSKISMALIGSFFILPSKYLFITIPALLTTWFIYIKMRTILNIFGDKLNRFVPVEHIIFKDRPLLKEKLWLLVANSLRILAYTLQMSACIYAFTGQLSPKIIALLPVNTLLMAVIPSFQAMGFALNSFVAILLFENLIPAEPLTLAVTLVWLCNVAFPAFGGIILPYLRPRYRLIRKKD